MATLKLTNVKKVYGKDTVAVDNFNLDIADKEFIVFVGPSGCGKSTTLRMIAGLEDISGGTIEIDGVVVNDLQPRDRNIAMVFQNYALYPHLTVFENMAFSLRLKKAPQEEVYEKVTKAAEILGITEYLTRKPRALSGGQRQRVAVGRCIVRKPAVFLFDEPLSNLDAKMRVQMRAEISKLHHKLATTMIYVTHDQIEAMTMGDRICVMKDGVIQQCDTPRNIYDNPANVFVAGFIGTPPMNTIKGRLEEENGQYRFKTDTLNICVPESWKKQLESYVGKNIIFGIRPEDIGSELAKQDPNAPTIEAVVDVREYMGAETYLYLDIGSGVNIIARVSAHQEFAMGEKLTLPLSMIKAHMFDPETEKRIL